MVSGSGTELLGLQPSGLAGQGFLAVLNQFFFDSLDLGLKIDQVLLQAGHILFSSQVNLAHMLMAATAAVSTASTLVITHWYSPLQKIIAYSKYPAEKLYRMLLSFDGTIVQQFGEKW